MGSIRFRNSVSLFPGLKLNINKDSVSLTSGIRGLKFTVNSKGTSRTTAGIPGTGLFYTHDFNFIPKEQSEKPKLAECPACGHRMRKKWAFCPTCNAQLCSDEEAKRLEEKEIVQTCPVCGLGLKKRRVYCTRCKSRLDGQPSRPIPTNKVTAPSQNNQIHKGNNIPLEEKSRIFAKSTGTVCPSCGQNNPVNVQFCRQCHFDLLNRASSHSEPLYSSQDFSPTPTLRLCPSCNTRNKITAMFCESCGFDFYLMDNKDKLDTIFNKVNIYYKKCPFCNSEISENDHNCPVCNYPVHLWHKDFTDTEILRLKEYSYNISKLINEPKTDTDVNNNPINEPSAEVHSSDKAEVNETSLKSSNLNPDVKQADNDSFVNFNTVCPLLVIGIITRFVSPQTSWIGALCFIFGVFTVVFCGMKIFVTSDKPQYIIKTLIGLAAVAAAFYNF